MNDVHGARRARRGGAALELIGLAVVAAVAVQWVRLYPAEAPKNSPPPSWREKDWSVWYHAHQFYHREPDELKTSGRPLVQVPAALGAAAAERFRSP